MSPRDEIVQQRMTRAKFLTTSSAGIAGLWLAACGGSSAPGDAGAKATGQAVASLAKDKGEINLITFESYHDKPWLDAYTKKTGVKVNAITAGSVDEMFAKTKSGTVPLDIGYFDLGSVQRYISADLVQPFDASKTPNVKDISTGLPWKKPLTIGGKLWGMPYNWGTQPLMWNADKVMSTPTSWEVLWDPAYKGKVTVPDDSYLGIPMVALAAGIKDPYNIDDAGFEAVQKKLKELRPQLKTLTTGFNDAVNLYGSGDCVVGYCQNVAVVNTLTQERKQNFSYGYPSEGTPFWIDNAILFKKGNRQEVYDFINEGLTTEWQGRFVAASGNDGILSVQAAKKVVPAAKIKTTEILNQEDASFNAKMRPMAPPNDFDRRVEIWNEFKASA